MEIASCLVFNECRKSSKMNCVPFASGSTKYLLFLFNVLIFVCSIIFIIYGIILMRKEDVGQDPFDNYSLSTLAIIVGVVGAVISYFGCYGTNVGNSCLLKTFGAVLIVLVISQLLLGFMSFIAIKTSLEININHSESRADFYIKKLFDNAKFYNNSEAWTDVNGIQSDWECCGVHNSSYWKGFGKKLPWSCCAFDEDMTPTCKSTDAYTDGCAEVFSRELRKSMVIIGGVALSFSLVEIIGIVCAMCVQSRK